MNCSVKEWGYFALSVVSASEEKLRSFMELLTDPDAIYDRVALSDDARKIAVEFIETELARRSGRAQRRAIFN